MDSVINESLRRGFGSMTKNDYEVFIFNELLKTSDYEGKSDFEISIKLKIPQSKVKRLRYEAALRNGGFEENDMKNEFLKCVLTANKEEKKIKFIIRNEALRNYLANFLENQGHYYDTSFNREIVLMTVDAFEILIKWADPGSVQKIEQEIQKKSPDTPFLDFLRDAMANGAGNLTSTSVVALLRKIVPFVLAVI